MTTYTITVTAKPKTDFLFQGAEGAKVYNQLFHGMDVHAIGSDPEDESAAFVELIIPFHAVVNATIKTTVTEDPEVEDAVCNET